MQPLNIRDILNYRRKPNHSYFVVMVDYGQRGLEAIVDPEITRREVVSRIRSGEYKDVTFIHHIADGLVEDVTDELFEEAGADDRVIVDRAFALAKSEG